MNFEISRIRTLFRQGKQILHDEGFLSLFKRSLFTYGTVYIYENTLHGPSIACKVNNLTLRIIDCLEDFDKLLADGFDFSSYEMSIQQCKERLGRGAILFSAFVGKELAHGSWVGMSRRSHGDFYTFPMDYGHTACIGGTMTTPKYRRKGINVYVYSEMFRYIREKGLSKAVFQIHKDNIASRSSQAKLGSYVWGTGHHLRLLTLFNFKWLVPIVKSTHRMRKRDR